MRRRGFCQILLELNKFFFMKYRKNSGCTAIFAAANTTAHLSVTILILSIGVNGAAGYNNIRGIFVTTATNACTVTTIGIR